MDNPFAIEWVIVHDNDVQLWRHEAILLLLESRP